MPKGVKVEWLFHILPFVLIRPEIVRHVVFQGWCSIPTFVFIHSEIVRPVVFQGWCSIPPFVLIRPEVVRPAGSEA